MAERTLIEWADHTFTCERLLCTFDDPDAADAVLRREVKRSAMRQTKLAN